MRFSPEELLRRLEVEFPLLPPPEPLDKEIGIDLEECLQLFDRKDWVSIDLEVLERGYNCLMYFDPQLGNYYIPAFLRHLLLAGASSVDEPQYNELLEGLVHYDGPIRFGKDWTAGQMRVVADTLDLCADVTDEALRVGESPFETHEPSEYVTGLRLGALKWRARALQAGSS